MKKLVYSLAVLFSVALVSCGGNKAAEATDSVESANVEVVEETAVVANDSETAVVATEAVAVEAPADSAK